MFVSILPQKTFVQQIGKDLVDIQVMVQPGSSPHIYEPKPKQMAALSRARIYFAIGVPFEQTWLPKIASANPKMKVVHTEGGIEKMSMEAHHRHDEQGEQPPIARRYREDDHGRSGLDPHIWLSPPLVKIQARTILLALQNADPANRSTYEVNYLRFVARVEELDTRLRAIFAGKQDLQFMVFHPAWGYFARTYGLEQVPIEIEGKSPKPAQLKELVEHAREKRIKVIFVQPQFSAKSANIVAAEIGGQVVVADPLAADWLANLQEVARKFEAALK